MPTPQVTSAWRIARRAVIVHWHPKSAKHNVVVRAAAEAVTELRRDSRKGFGPKPLGLWSNKLCLSCSAQPVAAHAEGCLGGASAAAGAAAADAEIGDVQQPLADCVDQEASESEGGSAEGAQCSDQERSLKAIRKGRISTSFYCRI